MMDGIEIRSKRMMVVHEVESCKIAVEEEREHEIGRRFGIAGKGT